MFKVISVFVVAFVVVALLWRWGSTHYSLPCPAWLSGIIEMDNPFAKEHHASAIVGHLALTPGMRVLDAGCGPGRVTLPLAAALAPAGAVVALDLQAEMLERVRHKAAGAGLHNIRLLQAGLGEGKLEREYYDRIVLVTVLGEIPDQQAALRELYGALKPGGILSVTEIIFDPHFQSRSAVLQNAGAQGFREKSFFGRSWAYTIHLEK